MFHDLFFYISNLTVLDFDSIIGSNFGTYDLSMKSKVGYSLVSINKINLNVDALSAKRHVS